MSDIHGCYDKYTAMLDKINLNDSDKLYVLGDVVDRGDYPIKVLQDMMSRKNVFPIMGNHDYIAAVVLEKLLSELTADDDETHIDKDFMQTMEIWLSDGGYSTFEEIKRLPNEELLNVLKYLKTFAPFKKVTVNGKKFILTHAGLPDSADYNNLEKYDMFGFVTAKTDYTKIYFEDIFLVTGHIPTGLIDAEYIGRVYRKNNHIAIDTGAVFGGVLSCVCLETDEEFYV